jgi:Fe-S-cluster containining protein
MIMQQQADGPVDRGNKKEQLHIVYDVYANWVKCFPLECQKSCSACCTQSVTMTSLEGEVILDFVKRKIAEKWLTEKLDRAASGKNRAAITTNQYAGICLEQREVSGDTPGNWNFTPCVFLEKNICSIYEVRPFGCRSFVSLSRCSDNNGAEIAPIHLTVNTVFTHVIEHLSSDGGYWGNMTDILAGLINNVSLNLAKGLLPAQPIPGFLLEPNEVKLIHTLLKQLSEQAAEKQTFGDLIDKFMSIL